MTQPDPVDFLDLRSQLDDEERMIQDTVRRFVDEQIVPYVADWFDEGTIPTEIAKELGALGLLGMHLEGYGCAGTNAVSYGLACLELEAGDSGLRSLVSVQGSLAMFPIWKYGSEEQKQEWLPRMAAGEAIGCFGLTEPDSGSDPSSMQTRAKQDGADWILNGRKMWITNGNIADVAVVWAMTDDGVRGFVVPTDTPGFSANLIHKKMSLRASITSELVLDDVRLPAEAVLPGVAGMRGPLSCLSEARYGIAWGAVGAARACYEAALGYSKERVQFGAPIASFQLTQKKLVDMMVAVNQGTMLALRLGRLKDGPGVASLADLDGQDGQRTIGTRSGPRSARNVLGANGVTLEYPVIRHMNNLESVYTYEGTNEIHTLILGQTITGIPAFNPPSS